MSASAAGGQPKAEQVEITARGEDWPGSRRGMTSKNGGRIHCEGGELRFVVVLAHQHIRPANRLWAALDVSRAGILALLGRRLRIDAIAKEDVAAALNRFSRRVVGWWPKALRSTWFG
jgi:hypothetical protein